MLSEETIHCLATWNKKACLCPLLGDYSNRFTAIAAYLNNPCGVAACNVSQPASIRCKLDEFWN